MQQTRIESVIERAVDMSTGFVISVCIYHYYILKTDWLVNNAVLVTTVFTIVSFIRGYLWRRFFNAGLHKIVHEFVRRFYATSNKS